jgi:hypothetical protein
MYIYIYICVCVCVCARSHTRGGIVDVYRRKNCLDIHV